MFILAPKLAKAARTESEQCAMLGYYPRTASDRGGRKQVARTDPQNERAGAAAAPPFAGATTEQRARQSPTSCFHRLLSGGMPRLRLSLRNAGRIAGPGYAEPKPTDNQFEGLMLTAHAA